MSDFYHIYGSDLSLTDGGQVALVAGELEVTQCLINRLMTNLGGMLGHPEYGAGLALRIGQPIDVNELDDALYQQIKLQAGVDIEKPFQATVIQNKTGEYGIQFSYTPENSNVPQNITLMRATQ